MRCDERLRRDDGCGKAALHIAGPTPIDAAIFDLAAKGVCRPATANLDHIQAEAIIRLLQGLRDDGRMIIVSTHDSRLVPIADRMRIGVAIFSYCHDLAFGITGDYDTASDISVLAEGMRESVAELVEAAGHVGSE